MTTTRSQLHLNKLDAFRTFCESRGWETQPVKSVYETLRMTKAGCPALIVHARDRATQHCTVHGISEQMVRAFLNQPNSNPIEGVTA